jgi:hypothetical protein
MMRRTRSRFFLQLLVALAIVMVLITLLVEELGPEPLERLGDLFASKSLSGEDVALRVVRADLPGCVELPPARGGEPRGAAVLVRNECERTLVVDVIGCETCGEPMPFGPGIEGEFPLEGDSLEEGSVQLVAWTLGEYEGVFEVHVSASERSGAGGTP